MEINDKTIVLTIQECAVVKVGLLLRKKQLEALVENEMDETAKFYLSCVNAVLVKLN